MGKNHLYPRDKATTFYTYLRLPSYPPSALPFLTGSVPPHLRTITFTWDTPTSTYHLLLRVNHNSVPKTLHSYVRPNQRGFVISRGTRQYKELVVVINRGSLVPDMLVSNADVCITEISQPLTVVLALPQVWETHRIVDAVAKAAKMCGVFVDDILAKREHQTLLDPDHVKDGLTKRERKLKRAQEKARKNQLPVPNSTAEMRVQNRLRRLEQYVPQISRVLDQWEEVLAGPPSLQRQETLRQVRTGSGVREAMKALGVPKTLLTKVNLLWHGCDDPKKWKFVRDHFMAEVKEKLPEMIAEKRKIAEKRRAMQNMPKKAESSDSNPHYSSEHSSEFKSESEFKPGTNMKDKIKMPNNKKGVQPAIKCEQHRHQSEVYIKKDNTEKEQRPVFLSTSENYSKIKQELLPKPHSSKFNTKKEDSEEEEIVFKPKRERFNKNF